jgi:hypothetical protein
MDGLRAPTGLKFAMVQMRSNQLEIRSIQWSTHNQASRPAQYWFQFHSTTWTLHTIGECNPSISLRIDLSILTSRMPVTASPPSPPATTLDPQL